MSLLPRFIHIESLHLPFQRTTPFTILFYSPLFGTVPSESLERGMRKKLLLKHLPIEFNF